MAGAGRHPRHLEPAQPLTHRHVRSVRIKDHHAEQRLFERRAIAAAVIMLIALGSVIARLVWLQVVQYDYFADLSQGNRIQIEPMPPNRGLILDRNGLPLATNAPSYQLELTREQVEDIDATLAGLAAARADRQRRHSRASRETFAAGAVFDAVPIKLQLTEEELARFAARRHQFPGVEIRPRLTRYYPLGASSVHAIGYVGAISEEDKKTLEHRRVRRHHAHRQERRRARVREASCTARAGFQQLLVNAQGRSVERIGDEAAKLERQEPVAGNDLFLTIDLRVQQVAEEALRGQRASAVAIDPANGDIIAFVSTPAFDPNLFARGLSRPQYLALTEDPDRPMYDRALRLAREELLLDLVDVRLESIDGGLVVVDDPVQDRVKGRAGSVLQALGVGVELLPDPRERAGLPVTDGDDEVLAQEDEHLAQLDHLCRVHVARASSAP